MSNKRLIKAILILIISLNIILICIFYFLSHRVVYVWDAIAEGNSTLVILLITFNPDLINSKFENNFKNELLYHKGFYRIVSPGSTLLHYAVYWGQEKIVRFLISKGIDVNTKDQYGVTPLYYAIKSDHPNKTMLISLVSSGADVNVKFPHGETPLHSAMRSCKESLEIVKILFSYGANINAKDEEGRTPLSIAIKYGYTDIIDFLRKHGAKE